MGFLLNLLLSRVLGPGNLGIFSLILTTSQTFEIAARGGVDYGLSCALTGQEGQRSTEERQQLAKTALQFVQITTLVMAVLLWIWVIPFQGIFPQGIAYSKTAICSGLIAIAIFESLGGLPWDIFLILGQTRVVALRQGLFAPMKLAAGLTGALLAGVGGAIAGYGLLSGLQTYWLRKRCQGFLQFRTSRQFSWHEAWKLVRSGLPLYGTNALAALVFLPLLGEVAQTAGVEDVGYLRIGQLIVQLFTLLPGALIPLLFLKLRGNINKTSHTRDTEPSLRLIWCLGLTALFVYIVIDHITVKLVFGQSFLPSLQPTRVLILAAVLDSANQVLHTPLLSSRRTLLFGIGQNSGAISAAAIGAWLIPQYGLQGYLIAKFSFSVIPVVIYSIDAWKKFETRSLLPMLLIATAAITPLCWWTEISVIFQTLLMGFSAITTFICAWPLRHLLPQN